MTENPTTPSPEPDAVPAPDVPMPDSPGPSTPSSPDGPSPENPAPDVPTPDPAGPTGPGPDSTPDPAGPVTPPIGVSLDDLPAAPDNPYYTEGGVPTFDAVREKIEGRYSTSVGAQELDDTSAAGQSFQEQWDAREKAAQERLAQLRASVRPTG